MLCLQGETAAVVIMCTGTHLFRLSQRGLPISLFARKAVGAPAAQEETREATEVGARSRATYDLLG